MLRPFGAVYVHNVKRRFLEIGYCMNHFRFHSWPLGGHVDPRRLIHLETWRHSERSPIHFRWQLMPTVAHDETPSLTCRNNRQSHVTLTQTRQRMTQLNRSFLSTSTTYSFLRKWICRRSTNTFIDRL